MVLIDLEEIRKKNLKRIGSPEIIELPLLDLNLIKIRDIRQIAGRAIILTELKSLTIYPELRKESIEWIEKTELTSFLSEKEKKALISKDFFSKQEEIDYSWYQESLTAALWVLGIVKDLEEPIDEFDIEPYVNNLPPTTDLSSYFKSATRISDYEIVKELDFYYLAHWIARRIEKKYHLSVVIERRKLLEWVADSRADWDTLTLDT